MSPTVLTVSAIVGFVGVVVSMMLSSHWVPIVLIAVLAFAQNISFTIVSRSRNRDNLTYHLIASVFSNGVWFLTFKELITYQMDVILFVPYTVGTLSRGA